MARITHVAARAKSTYVPEQGRTQWHNYNSKTRGVTPTPRRRESKETTKRTPRRSTGRKTEGGLSADTPRRGNNVTMRAEPPKGFSCVHRFRKKIPPITAINDGTVVVSCRRTRSVRTLDGTKEGVAPRLSHTGLMIAPPPPRCQMIEGLATETHSKQHVRGAQHVLRTRRSPLRVQADRSSQRVVMMSSPPSCRSHRSQKSAQQRTSSLASPTRRSRHLLTPPLISRSPQQSSFPWCIAITGNVRSFSCF